MERIFETKCGKIKGLEFEDRIELKNVVYAYAERFSYPSIATKWEGVSDGTKEGDNVYQEATFYEPDKNSFYEKEFSGGKSYSFSEDYLTLSITAPKGENLPVLLFIHGGGYETGMVNDLPYGGSLAYIRRGVILVSISYRMNVFGLYNDGDKYMGNYGLADQIAAIKWVRDNISAFGGDPNRITIIGQSAGAMSVDELCYVAELDGIIKGAIMMSGVSGVLPFGINFTTAKKSRKFWRAVEHFADCKNGDELKVAPAKRVFDAWREAKRKIAFPIAKQFPIIDCKLIKESPKKLYRKKERLNIPYIFGVTSQDMLAARFGFEAQYEVGKAPERKNRKPRIRLLFRQNACRQFL